MRVLIADDDPDMRLLTRALIGADPRLEVVAQAEDADGAVEAFRASAPDVCVLDYRMPRATGLDAARRIREERPEACIVLFSSFFSDDILAAADALGVQCLDKHRFTELADVVIGLTGLN